MELLSDIQIILSTYFLWCFIQSLYIVGIFYASQEGKLLFNISQYVLARTPESLHNPIIGCVQCMASLHAGLPNLVFVVLFCTYTSVPFFLGVLLFIGAIFTVPVVSALNIVISTIIEVSNTLSVMSMDILTLISKLNK